MSIRRPPIQYANRCKYPQLKQQNRQQRRQPKRFKSTIHATEATVDEVVVEPSYDTLKVVAVSQAIPFIGFGFMDNSILIIAGDAIDTSLGVALGISTMCAAALGNIVSDVVGILFGTVIEDFCSKVLKLPVAELTTAQRQLRSVRFASQFGCGIGIVIGCIVGMVPLYFIDSHKIEKLKRGAQLEAIFRDVVTEAKSLVGAESSCLYLRVEKDEKNEIHPNKKIHTSSLPYRPTLDGEYLYAMYYVRPSKSAAVVAALKKRESNDPNAWSDLEDTSRLIPVGSGIISNTVLSGEPCTVENIQEKIQKGEMILGVNSKLRAARNVVVVPVLDAQGNVIAALEAVNKRGSSFTNQDVQILSALASHISVSLKSHFYDIKGESEEVRLRETIQILKEQVMAMEEQQ